MLARISPAISPITTPPSRGGYAVAMSATVRFEVRGPLAIITLDDPPTRNALGPETADQLAAFARQVALDDAIRLVALTGANGVFCSGAAIRDWEQLPDAGATLTDRGTALCDLLEQLPVPVVALLGGHAVGGGAELALAADWRIVAPAAQLRFVHAGFGLIPGFGGLARLELLVGRSRALRYLASRASVSADEAVTVGLADEVVAADEQVAWAVAAAEQLQGADRGAVAAIKHALATGDERSSFLHVWPDRRLPDRLGS